MNQPPPEQWHHVPGSTNPAYEGSRGVTIQHFPVVGGGQILAFCGSLNIGGLMFQWETFEVMIRKYENRLQSCSPLARPKWISYYSLFAVVPFAASDEQIRRELHSYDADWFKYVLPMWRFQVPLP